MKIETDRVILREMNRDDLDDLYATMLADPVIVNRYPNLFNKQKVLEIILRNIEFYRTLGFGLWAVCLKETGEMIGECGLIMETLNGEVKPEIDYHIRIDMLAKGYATEAAMAVRDWAFENTPFQEIYLYSKYHSNFTSNTVKTLGFHFLYEVEKEEKMTKKIYVITKSDWLNMRA